MLDDASQPLHIRFLRVLADGVTRTGWAIAKALPDTEKLFREGEVYHTTEWLLKHKFVSYKSKGGTHHIYEFTITKEGLNELAIYDNGRAVNAQT